MMDCGKKNEILRARRMLKKRLKLCWDKQQTITGCDDQRRDLLQILKSTCEDGESDSLIILGREGSGKTMLLRSVLEELKETNLGKQLIKIELNGLLQTDDRIALDEITRQLIGVEMGEEENVTGTYSERMKSLWEMFRKCTDGGKPVLFVLEELDLFVKRPTQHLLYNLFDQVGSGDFPMLVIGLTSCLNVVEKMECRVKSRFSMRQIILQRNLSLEEYMKEIKSLLSLDESFSKPFRKEWKKSIKKLLLESFITEYIKKMHSMGANFSILKNLLWLPVCLLDEENPFITIESMLESFRNLHRNSKVSMLQGLSILELSLIIALHNLHVKYDGDPVNFEILYRELKNFSQQKISLQFFEKPVVFKAFEYLCSLNIILKEDDSVYQNMKEYCPIVLNVTQREIQDALATYHDCPMDLKLWASDGFVQSAHIR